MMKRRRHNSDHRLLIHTSVLDFIEAEAAKATRTETGGVLAGRGELMNGEVHLTHASEPGPRARKTMYSFARDTVFCQQFLDELALESKGQIDYLGEWHKHHEAEPRPSWTDIRTSKDIASKPDYHVELCLLLIIGRSNHRNSLRAFVVDRVGVAEKIGWAVCEACETISAGARVVPPS
jgi:integrative and conjugative element protein (TIGR02256 family)